MWQDDLILQETLSTETPEKKTFESKTLGGKSCEGWRKTLGKKMKKSPKWNQVRQNINKLNNDECWRARYLVDQANNDWNWNHYLHLRHFQSAALLQEHPQSHERDSEGIRSEALNSYNDRRFVFFLVFNHTFMFAVYDSVILNTTCTNGRICAGTQKILGKFQHKMHNSVRKLTSKFTKGQTKLMVQIILLCSNVWKV